MKMAPYAKSAPYYDLIYESIVDYEKECDLLEDIFQEHAEREVGKIIDLGCGTGNHAITLSSRGYEVLGVDQSETFIRQAREKARKLERPPSFQVGDMSNLRIEDHFDALICMFGGFGYIAKDQVPLALRGFADVTKGGGLLVFEFWNTRGVIPGYESWLVRESGDTTLIRLSKSEFEPSSGVLSSSMKHYVLKGRNLEDAFEELHRLTTYVRKEMRQYLRHEGLRSVAMFDWDRKVLEPAHPEAFRILNVARID